MDKIRRYEQVVEQLRKIVITVQSEGDGTFSIRHKARIILDKVPEENLAVFLAKELGAFFELKAGAVGEMVARIRLSIEQQELDLFGKVAADAQSVN